MLRSVLCLAVISLSTPLSAQTEKEISCRHQADIVEAIRLARVNGVKERDVQKVVLGAEHGWPENYDAAIPLMTPWVYEMKRRDAKTKDLAGAWNELCLKQ